MSSDISPSRTTGDVFGNQQNPAHIVATSMTTILTTAKGVDFG